nr:hypothetical protein B7L51_04595 [Pectobacterium carotovorum]
MEAALGLPIERDCLYFFNVLFMLKVHLQLLICGYLYTPIKHIYFPEKKIIPHSAALLDEQQSLLCIT